MMKVLHVLHTARAEGTVKLTLDWLAEPGLVQEVLVLNPHPPEMTAELKRRASWFIQDDGFPKTRAKFPWIVAKVWRVCRERRPDLVICWMNGFSPWVLSGAWLARVPKLITHAGNPPAWNLGGKVYTSLCTFATWMSGGRMVCCSNYVAAEFTRSPAAFGSVLRVVYNCAPVALIREGAATGRASRNDHRPRLIMVATLEPHKDHATLLAAMPAVVRSVPSVQLWLVGEGSLREPLQRLSASLGLAKAVTFLGSRRDVPALLGQSDAFVFSTTREEGLGTVLIEALAAGLPVIASDVPACREVLEDGQWGTLVPPNDAEALAAVIVAQLRSPMPEASGKRREYLQRFSPAGMIAGYLAAAS